jgi:Calx-beta domain
MPSLGGLRVARCLCACTCALAGCGDNDHLGGGQLLVTPQTGLHTDETGGTARFTVALTNEPDADITVDVESTDEAEGVVAPHRLMFTRETYARPQAVTITGVDDDRADGPQAYVVRVVGTGSIIDLGAVDVDVTNDDDDRAAALVAPTFGLLTTEGGGQATFQVSLTARPAAPVTIPMRTSNAAEGVIDQTTLVFTPGTWDLPQTVSITGIDDTVVDGAQPYTIVLDPATSDDPMFDGMDADDVQVTNVDDDLQAIVVTPTSGLVTTEAGGHDSFQVVLATMPTADVTITLASTAPTEATPSPATLVFTPANWSMARTVTVTGHQDHVVDGDWPFTIVLAPATSGDPRYAGLDPDDVTGINLDDDVPGITVTPTSGLVTDERGRKDWFSVVMDSQPVASVTIPIQSSDPGEGTAFPTSLVFTGTTWNQPQTVTVTGVNDPFVDGDQPYTIRLQPATSLDPVYAGFDADDVACVNRDNETAGFIVDPVAGLVVSEFGDSATFTIALTRRPTRTVRVTLTSSDLTEGFVFPAQVTFTPSSWNTPRTITVTGIDDTATDGNRAFTIVTHPATSNDPSYAGLDPPDVAVTNIDNETPQVYVKAKPRLDTTENGTTQTFQMRLTTAPTAAVTCPLFTSDVTEGVVNPAAVGFTPGSFGFQTVSVIGLDDAIVDGDQLYSILTAACTSADPAYAGTNPPDVSCVNRDND